MNRYIEFVLNRPKTVILSLLFITLLLGTGVSRLEFDNSPDVMMPKEDKRYLFNEEVKKIYGNVGNFIIISVTGNDMSRPDFFRDLDHLVTDIEAYQNVDEDKEIRRLERFEKLMSMKEVPYTSFIKSFDDDPAFQRDLTRRIRKNFGHISRLDIKKRALLLKELKCVFAIKQQGLIEDIFSPLTVSTITGSNDTLQKQDLIEKDEHNRRILPETAANFHEFENRLKKNPAFKNTLYATDSKTGEITDLAIIVKVENSNSGQDITIEIWDIAKDFQSLSPILLGVPVVNKVLNEYMQKDLSQFLPLIFLAILIIFYLNFRSLRGVCLPFIALVMADIWVLGLMGHLGIKMTIIGVSLPSLMIAVGSSYSIHILNQYYIDYDDITDMGKMKGLFRSMRHISITVVLAGLTTLVGFSSLLTNQVAAIREWGIFSAAGVLFAVIISTSLIPAGLILLPHKPSSRAKKTFGFSGKTWVDPVISFFIKISTQHHISVLATIGVLLVLSIIGIFKMQVDTAVIGYFKKNDPIRTSTIKIGEKFGGSFGMSILIDSGETDGIYNPDFLTLVDETREWMTSEENRDMHINNTLAFTDIVKSMHMAMNNDHPEFYAIPPTREEIMDYLELYEGEDENSDGRIDDLESYVDGDFRTLLLFAKLSDSRSKLVSTGEMAKTQKKIAAYLSRKLPPPYSFTITGEPSIFIALSEYVVKGQLLSLFFCLFAVSIIVTLLFKNIKAGLISLIPMSLAVIMNFGIMGWFHINLDTATAIIASVAIGIGVDDTIHFLNTYRHFKTRGLETDEAIVKTLSISGKAITYTSLALICGYSVMLVSNFKPLILMGLLTMITMIATTVGALAVLPAMIKTTDISMDESREKAWYWQVFDLGRFFNIGEEELPN